MVTWNDSVVVITGAGSGIGRALAYDLDARGARLVLSDVDHDAVRRTAEGCRDAVAHHLDVADRDAVRAHADQVAAAFGRVDVVVNNAGVALAADVAELADEDLDWLLSINLDGVITGSRAFLPHVVASRGHIVNVSSVFGFMGIPSQSAYNASKFGVRGFTEALAIEMDIARTGVGVHCVHPGGIATNIANAARRAPSRDDPQLIETFNRVFLRTSPEAAARAIRRGVERNRRRILIGADARLVHLGERLLGSGYQHLVARTASRLLPPAPIRRPDAEPPAVDATAEPTAPEATSPEPATPEPATTR